MAGKMGINVGWMAVVITLCCMVGCEKQDSGAAAGFDPEIDGIAVRPLPPVDVEMAKGDKTVPNHRSLGESRGEYVYEEPVEAEEPKVSDTPTAEEPTTELEKGYEFFGLEEEAAEPNF